MPIANRKIESDYITNEISKGSVSTKRKEANIPTPDFMVNYGEYLTHRNYAPSTSQALLHRTKQFWKYFIHLKNRNTMSIEDFRDLTYDDIKNYENYLINRVKQKEIKDETAYSCIKNIRIFLQFLHLKKVIDFPYTIPKKFMVKPTRLNIYINSKLIKDLILSTASEQSKTKYRDLALIFLLVDTGCRPIELSNLKISDLNLTERKITFNSIKSDTRTLILSDYVIKVLKRYVKERKLNTPSKYLFQKKDGDPISSANITGIIYMQNKKAFGQSLINARALRHTYITNAIENNNDLKDLATTVGHKHWESTLYYLHRSKKRLLANTLLFDPIKKTLEE